MVRVKRRIVAQGVVLTLALSMNVVAAAPAYAHDKWVAVPAQASVGPDHGSAVQAIAPPAPAGWQSASAAGASLASVPSPTISPSVTVAYIPPGHGYNCGVGNLCTFVWDPNYLWVDGQGGARLGVWKMFYLYVCREYALFNWLGDGYYHNNQTPAGLRGVRSYFRNMFHNTIGSYITPDNTLHWPYDWDPVWYIKNC
jgi:hypothetical protein